MAPQTRLKSGLVLEALRSFLGQPLTPCILIAQAIRHGCWRRSPLGLGTPGSPTSATTTNSAKVLLP